MVSSSNVTNTGTITGGKGGDGVGLGGGGGGGGAAFIGTGSAIVPLVLTNSKTITGGAGGLTGSGSGLGGQGGAGSGGALGGHRAGAFSEGGVGILGSHLSITHGGVASSINGGLSGNGVRADAIRFTGGTNRLELRSGYSILGNVNGNLGSNTLALGGTANASFSAFNLGSSAQFQGFSSFQKTGTSTWTLTDTTTAATPWTINAGILSIADDASLGASSGALTLAGGTLKTTANTTSARAVTLGAGGGRFDMGAGQLTLGGSVSGTGDLTKNGTGTLFLTGDNSAHTGRTLVNGGFLRVGAGGTTGTLGTGAVTVASGANLVFNRSDNLTVANAIAGAGTLDKYGAGKLTLSGANKHTGNTWIYAGTLDVSGSLNSTIVKALGNATLTSSGVGGVLKGAVTIQDTAHLALSSGTLLTVGALVFNSNANFDANLGANTSGNRALVKVNGNLTLGGKLNVTDAGGFGPGVYRLIDYTGTLTPGAMTIGTVPASYLPGQLTVQTAVSKQVNVVVDSPTGNLRFWNGGTGTWNTANTNWTLANGTPSQTWANDFAVFQGTARSITVVGAQSFTGLQFATTGYSLKAGTGGKLNAVNASTGPNAGTTVIRVDPGVTATLSVPIIGSGTLSKLDTGTLVLSGANTYTGGTRVSGGVLQGNTTSLQGNIVNNANVTFNQSTNGSYAGVMSGSGALRKIGTKTLTLSGNNTYTGGTTVSAGTLQGSASSLKGNIVNNANVTFDQSTSGTYAGSMSGNGVLNKIGTDTLILTGNNSYTGGTTVSAGTLQGSASSLKGNIVNNANVTFDQSTSGTYADSMSGSGVLTKIGTGELILTGNNSAHSGRAIINSGDLLVGDGGMTGTLGTGAVTVASGAQLTFNRGDDFTVANAIDGAGNLRKSGSGMLTLSGTNTLIGNTAIAAGTLNVTGSLNSADVQVTSGSTLTGTGTLTGATHILNGGHVVLSTGKLLTVGSLVLDGTSNVDVRLGAPSTGGASLLKVNGDVTLGGKLNVTDAGGFGTGVYRLIDYTGVLTGSMGVGYAPTPFLPADMTVQTAVAKQVNVVVASPTGNMRFWNGSTTTAGGAVNGGSGNWNGASTNWTSSDGTQTQGWANDFAVFQGTPGTVTVDGAQSFTGLQFVSNGYTLQTGAAGTLTAINGGSGSATVRVDPGMNATLDVPIIGSGALTKLDAGTLTLLGANSYSGGTTVSGGVLQGNTTSLRGNIVNNATVAFDQSASGTYAGTLSGSGTLRKMGTGDLLLSNANTYSGGTALKTGRINVGHKDALGTGTLAMDDGTALGVVTDGLVVTNQIVLTGNNDPVIDTGAFAFTLGGAISGAGFITKQGTGTLTLGGANTYSGATDVSQGTLQAGAANAFSAASAHSVAAGSTLDLAGLNQSIAGMNLAAGGTVRLFATAPGGAPGTTLKVTGPWVGSGGTLQLSSALGDNSSPTDRLLLSGAAAVASGQTSVRISNIGGLGAMTTGDGIAVVATELGARIDNGAGAAFTLDASHSGGHVDAGAYEYRLNTTTAGAYLTSTNTAPGPGPLPAYRAEVPLFSALPAQLRQASLAMLGHIPQRDDDAGQVQATGDASTALAASGPTRHAWGRVISTDIDVRQSGTVNPNSTGRLNGFQVGTDVLSVGNWHTGVYVGQMNGTPQISGFASGMAERHVGSNDLRNQYVAAYGSYRNATGFYADAVLQMGRHRMTVQPLNGAAVDNQARSVLTSLEVGQAYPLAANWTIEPQLQVVHQRLSLDDSLIAGARVEQSSNNAWLVRAGLRVKGTLATGAGTVQPYARLSFLRASGGSDQARFVGPAGSTNIAAQTGYSSTELAAGASMALSRNTVLFGELSKSFSSGGAARVQSGVQASLGIQVRW